MTASQWPVLGCGLGLRAEHYDTILRTWPKEVDWFEAITENYMDSGGRSLQILEKVRSRYPIGLHGVSLSIGSCDPLDRVYLNRLKTLAERIEPAIISDHLCWTGVKQRNLHDLLPLPFTEEALKHVAHRVCEIQNFLNRKILLENVSSYLTFKHSYMPEWEFLSEVSRQSGCGILLDINNVYVNAQNHKFDAYQFLNSVPIAAVGQFHLAGHTSMGKYLFDTHNKPVIEPVWALYRHALKRFGKVTTLIEWDADIPEFPELVKELKKAKKLYQQIKSEEVQRVLEFPINVTKKIDKKSKAPKLAEVQRLFEECVLPNSKDAYAKGRIAKMLNPQGGDPGKDRLSVYAEGYTARMNESLTEVYPAVKHLVGEPTFLKAAFGYSKKYPSKNYNLSLAGKHYSSFLKKSSLALRLPFLPDLADLEWEIAESFHTFDLPAADMTKLHEFSEEDWQSIILKLQPSVRLIASRWPVLDLWNVRAKPPKNISLRLEGRPQNVLVYKGSGIVRCELISREQHLLLKDLLTGKTLGKALSRFVSLKDPSRLAFSDWFAGWAAKGIITGYLVTPVYSERSKIKQHSI